MLKSGFITQHNSHLHALRESKCDDLSFHKVSGIISLPDGEAGLSICALVFGFA